MLPGRLSQASPFTDTEVHRHFLSSTDPDLLSRCGVIGQVSLRTHRPSMVSVAALLQSTPFTAARVNATSTEMYGWFPALVDPHANRVRLECPLPLFSNREQRATAATQSTARITHCEKGFRAALAEGDTGECNQTEWLRGMFG